MGQIADARERLLNQLGEEVRQSRTVVKIVGKGDHRVRGLLQNLLPGKHVQVVKRDQRLRQQPADQIHELGFVAWLHEIAVDLML